MATKKERIVGSVLGGLIGAFLGNEYSKNNNINKEDRWKYILTSAFGGAFSGYVLAILFGSPDNTVNYQLVHGKRKVYHGITYADRIPFREMEHKASGKRFSKMITDLPKPRVEALEIERKLIKSDKPKYNIHHNC